MMDLDAKVMTSPSFLSIAFKVRQESSTSAGNPQPAQERRHLETGLQQYTPILPKIVVLLLHLTSILSCLPYQALDDPLGSA